jgi:hypothetical protein
MELAEIWRYPVKSMLGEQVDEAAVGPDGIRGDRQWAVVDVASGVSLSAKRYAALLHCRAWTRDGQVMVGLPDGRAYPAGCDVVARELTELLGRQVTMRTADATEPIRHEFPTAVTEGEGEPFLWQPGTNAFFDSSTLHLLTTGTLAQLRRLMPGSVIHQARFRPNFLVVTDETGFVEHGWIDKNVTLGSLRCRVTGHTRRCVMVTRDQGDLPRDVQVIRTIVQQNEGRAGVAMEALASALLRRGAEVSVDD